MPNQRDEAARQEAEGTMQQLMEDLNRILDQVLGRNDITIPEQQALRAEYVRRETEYREVVARGREEGYIPEWLKQRDQEVILGGMAGRKKIEERGKQQRESGEREKVIRQVEETERAEKERLQRQVEEGRRAEVRQRREDAESARVETDARNRREHRKEEVLDRKYDAARQENFAKQARLGRLREVDRKLEMNRQGILDSQRESGRRAELEGVDRLYSHSGLSKEEAEKQDGKREFVRHVCLERQDGLDRAREEERRKEVERQDGLDRQRMADRWADQDRLDKEYGED
jgi:hypothetical protein